MVTYGSTSHGQWCNASTHTTTCTHCKSQVFFFSCDCGCKVFFDSLGWPWPRHYCQGYFEDQFREQLHQRVDASKVTKCDPRVGARVDDVGILHDTKPANIFRKFGVAALFADEVLGDLTINNFVEATVYVGEPKIGPICSYSFLVKEKDWNRVGPIAGDILSFTLESRTIPGYDSYWLCTDVDMAW